VLHLPVGRQKLEQSNEQLMLADWTWGKETTRLCWPDLGKKAVCSCLLGFARWGEVEQCSVGRSGAGRRDGFTVQSRKMEEQTNGGAEQRACAGRRGMGKSMKWTGNQRREMLLPAERGGSQIEEE
jgi:hypothetical protein